MRLHRSFALLAFALMALTSAACDDVIAPLTGSVMVEINGPSYTVAAPADSGYTCDLPLYAKASTLNNSNGVAEWSGASVFVTVGQSTTRTTLTATAVADLFGDRIWTGGPVSRSPLHLTLRAVPSQIKVIVTYFDPNTGYTGTAKFDSSCRM